MRVEPLATDLVVKDAGDVEVYSGEVLRSCHAIEEAVAFDRDARRDPADPRRRPHDHLAGRDRCVPTHRRRARSRSSTSTRTRTPATSTFGSLYGHGQPMRRLIESGAVRGDRFLQLGLRGYWPEPETLDWMADQRMNSFHMSEIVARGLDAVLG